MRSSIIGGVSLTFSSFLNSLYVRSDLLWQEEKERKEEKEGSNKGKDNRRKGCQGQKTDRQVDRVSGTGVFARNKRWSQRGSISFYPSFLCLPSFSFSFSLALAVLHLSHSFSHARDVLISHTKQATPTHLHTHLRL